MLNTDAEAQCSHGRRFRDLVLNSGEHFGSPGIVAGVDLVELVEVVPASGETDPAQINPVGNPEVVKRYEQICPESVPEAQFAGYTSIEELGSNIHSVSSLGRRRQAEEIWRDEVIKDPPVGSGFC